MLLPRLLLPRLEVLLLLPACAAARRTFAAASSMRSMAESGRRLSGMYLHTAQTYYNKLRCPQVSLALSVHVKA
jgi:hypothetical protein